MTAVLFIASILLIVAASELFTNAVEWAGYRFKLASGATGSLLAAIGTALPETAVPVVALLSGGESSESVAIGAVLGAPLLLLTLGVAVTGLAVVTRRRAPVLALDRAQARRDLSFFLVAFALSIGTALLQLPHGLRVSVGIGLLAIYAVYALATLRGGAPAESMPEPLHIIRWDAERVAGPISISGQLIVSMVMLIGGAQLFVEALTGVATTFHIDPLILAIILVPVATELPETMNSVLWVRSGDDGLAFGNVAGSATFQACILGFIGLSFTSWHIGASGFLSSGVTLLTAVGLLLLLRNGRARGRFLILAGLPWLLYVLIEIATGGRLAH